MKESLVEVTSYIKFVGNNSKKRILKVLHESKNESEAMWKLGKEFGDSIDALAKVTIVKNFNKEINKNKVE